MAPKATWFQAEDVALCKAYIENTEDPIHGINKIKTGFWTPIIATMYAILDSEGTSYTPRSKDAIIARWKKQLFPNLNKWAAATQEAARACASGTNLLDQHIMAMSIYRTQNRQAFNLQHCWEIVKDCFIFSKQTYIGPDALSTQSSHRSSQPMESPPGYPPQYNFSSDEAPTNTPEDLETPIVDQHGGISIGTKKARKDKGNDSSSSNQQNEIVERLRSVEQTQIMLEAGRARRHVEMLAEKAKDDEYKIMSMDTSSFSPDTKAYWKGKRKEIQKKQLQKDLFGGSSNLDDL